MHISLITQSLVTILERRQWPMGKLAGYERILDGVCYNSINAGVAARQIKG